MFGQHSKVMILMIIYIALCLWFGATSLYVVSLTLMDALENVPPCRDTFTWLSFSTHTHIFNCTLWWI